MELKDVSGVKCFPAFVLKTSFLNIFREYIALLKIRQ